MCWKRFVVCKELCQLILDSAEKYTKLLPSLLERLVGGQIPGEPMEDVAFEHRAEIMEMELLFPEHFEKGRLSLLKVVTIFRIPRNVPEEWLPTAVSTCTLDT